MTRKETIQSQGAPAEWPSISHVNWKWLNDLYLLLTGREGRQNFINTLVNSKPNNSQSRSLFVNETNGDAVFSNPASDPYLSPSGTLVVPISITATRREISNVGAVSAYQSVSQSLATSTPTTLVFDVEEFDQDAAYSLGAWQPTKAGKYIVTASFGFPAANIVVNRQISISIVKNGVLASATAVHTSVAKDIVIETTKLLDMNGTTDSCYVSGYHEFGAAAPTLALAATTYFCAVKVN